ncbi:peptidase M50 [Mycolicibacterium mucogenicum]|uniref:Peptidase M50 n=1 Tax=Mycolicibacterium mucogenicum TaxID=56689 RepID=A0A4R5WBG5_MYCMU|nr:peptidase M50 [Mycolicibacterium mucogenicum]
MALVFGDRRTPRALANLTALQVPPDGAPTIPDGTVRIIVVGDHADLSATLARLLRDDRLDVEVGFVPPLTRGGLGAARRARDGVAQRVPLIRDETGAVIVRSARWLPSGGDAITGEAVVDDTVLFDGQSAGVVIEPLAGMPGLRARALGAGRSGPGRGWVAGRAAQLGSTGVLVERDGVAAARPARRSAFYRHIQGWLRVG